MPLAVAAAQPAHLQAEDDAGVVHAHLGDHALEAVAFLGGLLAGLTLVVVDDQDALSGPAQGRGGVGQGILALSGFAMMADLVGAGLPDIDQGEPLAMMGADLRGTWKWSGCGVVGLGQRVGRRARVLSGLHETPPFAGAVPRGAGPRAGRGCGGSAAASSRGVLPRGGSGGSAGAAKGGRWIVVGSHGRAP